MQYAALGETGLTVSRLSFGTLTLGPWQARMPVEEGAALIRRALSLGINCLDTAECYHTYPYIREALKGLSEKPIVISRSYAHSREGMRSSVARALLDTGLSYLDVFMLHEQESPHTLRGHTAALEYLVEAKEEGLIGAVGISTHHTDGVRAAIEEEAVEVVFAVLNRKGMGIRGATLTEMEALLSEAAGIGKGVMAMKALGGGNLYREAASCLAYTRDLPFIHTTVVGMKTEAELLMNARLFSGEQVSGEQEKAASGGGRRLHIEFCQGCGSCIEACPFHALRLEEGKAVVDYERCLLCTYCASVCPHFCIKVL